MLDLIRRLLVWAGLSAPRSRSRSAAARPPRIVPALLIPEWAPLPAHRSPYGLDTLLDGAATVTVRPYLAAPQQRRRRHEPAMVSSEPDLPAPFWSERAEVV
ncbi:hypothetical protein GCM10017668_37230 [Streptomyces tuirus]|uniref:Uncharacterized protein n=1 Tax=Streptomyces tuirus TaxID=68278 RepID=A0A7G1NJM8_9ACTN|nr:hypothetical protein GCM10017668_37230 [Streptomyces tuirus]